MRSGRLEEVARSTCVAYAPSLGLAWLDHMLVDLDDSTDARELLNVGALWENRTPDLQI